MSKYCDICGNKCGLLTRERLKDGLICENCSSKLSYWFRKSERLSKYTITEINEQLRVCENNKKLVRQFHPTQQFQLSYEIVLKVDESAEKFMIVNQRKDSNPDVLDFSKFIKCVINIEEETNRHTHDSGEGYFRFTDTYDTTCNFYIDFQVDSPYYAHIKVENSRLSLQTSLAPDDPFRDPYSEESKKIRIYEKNKREKEEALLSIIAEINCIFMDYHKRQEEAENNQRKRQEEAENNQRKIAINEKIKEIAAVVTNQFDESELLQASVLSARDKVKEYGKLREFCIRYMPELKNKQVKVTSGFNLEFQVYVDTAMCQLFDSNWTTLSKAFFTLSRGVQGENNVEEVLSLYDDRIYYICNYTWIYEHDFIVIAPSGIYTIEVKMLSDDYVLSETGMLKPLNYSDKKTMNVVLQSRKHVETLRKGLKECNAFTSDIPINEIICCADGNHIIRNEFPDIAVCYCNNLNKYIFPDDVENKLTPEKMIALKDFLMKNREEKRQEYAVFGDHGDLSDRNEFVQSFAYTVGVKYVRDHFDSFFGTN